MLTILDTAPNPQFAREAWVDLTGTWKFRYDDDNTGMELGWWSAVFGGESLDIRVPYPPESRLSGINDPSFHPWEWYQRSLPAPGDHDRERTLIHFGAVDYQTTVWIDGVFVGQHTGGSSPFTVDVSTAWLRSLEKRLLTLRVFDDPVDLEQPRGKQGWKESPERIWYKRTTGIWQPVWMETAPVTYITHNRWVFNAEKLEINLEVELNRTPDAPTEITATLSLPDGRYLHADLVTASRHGQASMSLVEFSLPESLNRLLWSPESPTLLPTSIETAGGDEVRGYVGLRSLHLDIDGFRINQQPVWLAMVLSQGYFPESHYAAPSADAIRNEVELILALGFNGARTHQKAEDPRFLYHADRLGLLLWGEIGAAQAWSDRSAELLTNEWRELVRRDINHPSIIAWTPFNESWGIEDVASRAPQQQVVRAVYELTHALDGTRPVVDNDGYEHVITDTLSLHDYHWNGTELARRYSSGRSAHDVSTAFSLGLKRAMAAGDVQPFDRPVMITEYGGVSFIPAEDQLWFGYGKVADENAFLAKYEELTSALQASNELIGVCYTQLTDTEQETNGLLRADRTPKVDIAAVRRITRGKRI